MEFDENQQTEPNNLPRRPRRVAFMRNYYLFLHYFGVCIYIFLPNSFFSDSFHKSNPVIFCISILCLFSILRFYALSCQGAGYQTTEPANPEGLFFSKDAGIHCQVRACYCKVCKRVVLRRDHHCPWTGHCIGRDNNVYFLMFTSIEGVVCSLFALDGFRALYLNWVLGYGYFYTLLSLVLIVAEGFAAGFTSALTIQTLHSIAKNITIWEGRCHDKITYLKDYPDWVSPFDKGIIGNFKEFFTMRQNQTVWQLPDKPDFSSFAFPASISQHFDEYQKIAERYHRHNHDHDHHH